MADLSKLYQCKRLTATAWRLKATACTKKRCLFIKPSSSRQVKSTCWTPLGLKTPLTGTTVYALFGALIFILNATCTQLMFKIFRYAEYLFSRLRRKHSCN